MATFTQGLIAGFIASIFVLTPKGRKAVGRTATFTGMGITKAARKFD